MPDILFHIPTRVVFGLDTINRIGQLVSEYGERAFLVTEAILYEGKTINKVQEILDKKGTQYIVFDEVVPNATSRTVDDGVTLARGAHAEVVIGLGGMRTLSIAKAIAMTVPSGSDMDDFLSGVQPQTPALAYIEVPTTCRNPFLFADEYLIVDGRDRTGRIGRTQKGITKAVLIDPKLSLTLPGQVHGHHDHGHAPRLHRGVPLGPGELPLRHLFHAGDRDPRQPDPRGHPERGRHPHADEREHRGAARGAGPLDEQAGDRLGPRPSRSTRSSWRPSRGCRPSCCPT